MEDINEISYKIRKAIFSVFNTLGPGLLESVYEAVLIEELRALNLKAESQVPLPVVYKNVTLALGFRIDILVENLVLIEIKSVEKLHDVHKKQVLTYLKLSGIKLGILVNFNAESIVNKESIYRIIN